MNPGLEAETGPQQTAVAVRRGQACDRCRQKKIKCDAALPNCSNCVAAGVSCDASTRLRRRTTVRGFATTQNAPINTLESEVSSLKAQVQRLSDERHALRHEVELMRQSHIQSYPRKMPRSGATPNTAPSPIVSISADTDLSASGTREYIFRHMGRMVIDETGNGRWSGSTTGAHFISSVDSLCRKSLDGAEGFPDHCFRLHLLQPLCNGQSATCDWIDSRMPDVQALRALFKLPLQYLLTQIDLFNTSWAAFCPVLLRKQMESALAPAMANLWISDTEICADDRPILLTMLVVLSLNRHYGRQESAEPPETASLDCDLMIEALYSTLGWKTDISTIQCLVLFALYLQVHGQSIRLSQLTGRLVSIVQALGMHRHAQRFCLNESEVEFRKRIWWFVYGLDKLTAIVHGTPRLIQDLDVDNDLPIDCDLQSLDEQHPAHPLPGEPSPVSLFIYYIQLLKITSSILGQLYTTTDRRGGLDKIARLDREIRVWNASLNKHTRGNPFEVGRADKTISRLRAKRQVDNEDRMTARLELLANYAMVLIHRPGLTFDSETPGFHESLRHCLQFYTSITTLLSASQAHLERAIELPFGPSLLFQSGLLHVFCHHHQRNTRLAKDVPVDESQAVIARAVDVIRGMKSQFSSDAPTVEAIDVSADLLERVAVQHLPLDHEVEDGSVAAAAASGFSAAPVQASIDTPDLFDPLPHLSLWDTHGMDSLADLDAASWDMTQHVLFDPASL